jgi:hypothetical protein
MTYKACRRFRTVGILTAFILVAAAPARAQYRPRFVNNPYIGETFRVEAGVAWWNPSADMKITSAGSGALTGVPGTEIDAKTDLGFTDKRLPQFNVVLRPGEAHKFRFQYIPINYSASSQLVRNVDFNGQRYLAGLPVNSTLEWKAYRFGYEWDFLRRDQGFVGFITELKYTDFNITLSTPLITEFVHEKAPIPALGGIGRVYLASNFSVTGELTAFKLTSGINEEYQGHYVDFDVYGTINFSKNVGVQGGYRTLNLGYLIKQDTGSFLLKGIYFGVVGRF